MEKKRNDEKKRKNYVIVFALVVLFLSVGYATFVQPLAHKPPIWSYQEWDVGFIESEKVATTGEAVENHPVSHTLTRGYFNITLHKPGDSITYDFTIKNMGNIDAKVQNIYISVSNEKTDAILFSTSGVEVGDVLEPGETVKLKVKASYNPNVKGGGLTRKELFVVVNYVQK